MILQNIQLTNVRSQSSTYRFADGDVSTIAELCKGYTLWGKDMKNIAGRDKINVWRKAQRQGAKAVDKGYYHAEQDKGVIDTRQMARVPWNLLSTIAHESDMSSLPNNPIESGSKNGKLLPMKREFQRSKIFSTHYDKEGNIIGKYVNGV